MSVQQREQEGGPAGPGTILVERWTKGLVEDQDDSTASTATEGDNSTVDWVQDWRSNTPSDIGTSMPCLWVCDEKRRLGDETMVKDIAWRIVEIVPEKDEDEES